MPPAFPPPQAAAAAERAGNIPLVVKLSNNHGAVLRKLGR